jgi:hypothetical protein
MGLSVPPTITNGGQQQRCAKQISRDPTAAASLAADAGVQQRLQHRPIRRKRRAVARHHGKQYRLGKAAVRTADALNVAGEARWRTKRRLT